MDGVSGGDAAANPCEEAMRAALSQVDRVREQLEREREAVAQEREAARAAKSAVEAEGARIADAYFEQRREELLEFARRQLRRELVLRHAARGAAATDIAEWLDMQLSEVERLVSLSARRGVRTRGAVEAPRHARLNYESSGRGGTIVYRDDVTTFSLWWEFAGGDALVLIGVPGVEQWEKATGLPASERARTLRFVAEQVIADQVSNGVGHYEVGEQTLTIYSG